MSTNKRVLQLSLTQRQTQYARNAVHKLFAKKQTIPLVHFLLHEVYHFSQEVIPPEIREAAYQFARQQTPQVLLFIEGNPLREDLPPTSSALPSIEDNLLISPEESILLAYTHLFGDPFAWASQQLGRLICQIMPLQHSQGKILSTGSDQRFGWHTEDAVYGALMCSHLLFLCLRNNEQVPTRCVCATDLRLEEPWATPLWEPRYCIRPNPSHANYEKMVPPLVPIAFGSKESPFIRINTNMEMLGNPDDKEARTALDELLRRMNDSTKQIEALHQPGSMTVIDNLRAPHARDVFEPWPEVSSRRWLIRSLANPSIKQLGSRWVVSNVPIVVNPPTDLSTLPFSR